MVKKLLLVLLASFFVFTSCNKDDEEKANTGKFTIGGTEHTISNGWMVPRSRSSEDVGYKMSLYLYTDDANFSDANGVPTVWGGGYEIFLWTYSSEFDGLSTGNYLFEDVNYTDSAGTFVSASYITKHNAYSQSIIGIEGGSLEITRNGDRYEIEFDLINDNGNNMTGNYSGTLDYYNLFGASE